jgi:hypothetical protein
MRRSHGNCGWGIPKKRGGTYCGRKKRMIDEYFACPCPCWVHRLRIDRLKAAGRRGFKGA